MKGSNKFKITSVVGPHTCGSAEPNQNHRQLMSKFIANHLLPVVKQDPTISIHGVIGIVTFKWNYTVKYGNAWRAHQRALRMIYGSWEDAYERLPVMLNAMKVANPGMHYEYLSIPNVELNGQQVFQRAFWCFDQCVEAFKHMRPIFSIDGTFAKIKTNFHKLKTHKYNFTNSITRSSTRINNAISHI
jgi:hypothetical protein